MEDDVWSWAVLRSCGNLFAISFRLQVDLNHSNHSRAWMGLSPNANWDWNGRL